MIVPWLVGGIAFIATCIFTPAVRIVAGKLGIVDTPDGRRKLHDTIIPLGGGVGVLLGSIASLWVVCSWTSLSGSAFQQDARFFVGLGAAALLIVVVGLIDDRFGLRGRQKLAGQVAAVGLLIFAGLSVNHIQLFGWSIELGLLSVPFTMFWLLGAINAFNLIDGIDGLATSVGVILSLAIAGMAWATGHPVDAVIALALCGSLLGFLVYNFPPASIFLGDAGSMLIGLLLGVLAIRSSLKGPATVALAAPAVMWAIPIFDVSMAILRRKLTGRSLYETDRGHLHHCLLRRGFSGRKTLLWIGVLCACTAGGALISVMLQNEWFAVLSAALVLGIMILTRLFGHSECLMLGHRVKSLLHSFMPFKSPAERIGQRPIVARLTGTRDWDELWATLIVYAERFDLSSIQLNVNLPALNEEYHANWRRKHPGADSDQWTTSIPLFVHENVVGRLHISGHCSESFVCTWMGDLIAGLRPFEIQMIGLLTEQSAALLNDSPVSPSLLREASTLPLSSESMATQPG